MPKRFGYLIPLIIAQDNMDRAFDEVVDQLPERKKRLPNGQIEELPGRRSYYRKQRSQIIASLTRRIEADTFRVYKFTEMEVTDGPKNRIVQSPCVVDRIGCNAIMRVVEDKVLDIKQLEEVSQIPSRDILLGRLFGSMQSPVANFARVIKQISEKDGEGEAVAAAE